jgi:FtsP/CotA-like multicopper oxidase with cupredoxin domain
LRLRWQATVEWQSTEGLWGPLIIRKKVEAYRNDYDEEITLTLTDWYHTTGRANSEWWLAGTGGAYAPIPFSILMNGKGNYPCHLTNLPCKRNQSLPTIRVTRGKRYRFRVINTSTASIFFLSLPGQKLGVVETDGTDIVRLDLDRLPVAEGQRYSFIVELNGKGNEEWLIVQPTLTYFHPNEPNINKHPETFSKEVPKLRLKYTGSGSESGGVTVRPGSSNAVGRGRDKTKDYPPINEEALAFEDQHRMTPLDGVLAPNYFDVEITIHLPLSKLVYWDSYRFQ